mmetsp:Transcript_57005/g.121039  ORF Transcript_57005/g.121039 Transcript_57005/m.121039 type:complete len:536 (+) Transcript_57005:120-1727(+)
MSAGRTQAYQLKAIRFQNAPRKILLQNENGPCPLLAAANALLLRGVITLDPVCVRNGVASTEDVVNVLANWALLAGNSAKENLAATNQRSDHAEYHLNEVLSLLPDLQHGMDVNPKFTSGPTGVEYTKNLAAFDLLGVELVHGWLLDEQDAETASVVGSKTYNELIEIVIQGNEAREEVARLEGEMREKESKLEGDKASNNQSRSVEVGDDEGSSGVGREGSGPSNDSAAEESAPENSSEKAEESGNTTSVRPDDGNSEQKVDENENEPDPGQPKKSLTEEIAKTREKISELSLQITKAAVANAFLTSSGHQLTYHGLEQLHKHLGNDALSVFFRNNHFATITKHDGVLYLLATDLGYANTPEIVWEKLDDIDGDTEYANEFFKKPAPRAELGPAPGPAIAPELLLAQRSQAETDYQLALAMSKGAAATGRTDDDEGRLMEAAKELSLKTYNGDANATVNVGANNSSQADSDTEAAMAYQRQSEHESEQLARQLQELEYARQPAGRAPAANRRRPTRPAAPPTRAASSTSSCAIS